VGTAWFSRIQGVRARFPNVVVLAGLVCWAGSVWAGPGVIVQSRVEAFAAPSRDASVAAELGLGAPVCVLDETNHAGMVMKRIGWLAIRIPGGVGYVPVEAVDVRAPAPEVRDCGATTSEPVDPATSQEQTQAQAPAPMQGQAQGQGQPQGQGQAQGAGQPQGQGQAQGAGQPQGQGQPQGLARGLGTVRRPRATPILALSPRTPAAASDAAAIARPPLVAGRFVPLHPVGFLLNLGLGEASLDKQSAAQHRIGDTGITFNGALGFTLWDVVMFSAAFSLAFPTDDGSFTQVVEPETGPGGPRAAESSLTVHSVSAAIGLRTPYLALGASDNGWVATALFAEYGSAVIGGSRSITDCVDCREDDLEMPGGTFWRVGVDLVVPTSKPTFSWGLTASYQRYAAGTGFSDEVRIGFSCWWHSPRS
jgi:hypothetical protein